MLSIRTRSGHHMPTMTCYGQPSVADRQAPTAMHPMPHLVVHLALVRVRQCLVRRRDLRELLLRLLLVVEVAVRMPLPGRKSVVCGRYHDQYTPDTHSLPTCARLILLPVHGTCPDMRDRRARPDQSDGKALDNLNCSTNTWLYCPALTERGGFGLTDGTICNPLLRSCCGARVLTSVRAANGGFMPSAACPRLSSTVSGSSQCLAPVSLLDGRLVCVRRHAEDVIVFRFPHAERRAQLRANAQQHQQQGRMRLAHRGTTTASSFADASSKAVSLLRCCPTPC